MLARLLGAALLALACLVVPAFAADTSVVAIPLGSWTEQVAAVAGSVVLGILLWLLRQLPPAIYQALRTAQAEQLLGRAVDYALNAVAGAAKGKTLSVDVGNAVVAAAASYAVENGPGMLIRWLGGPEAIERMILARIHLGPDAEIVGRGAAGVTIVPAPPQS